MCLSLVTGFGTNKSFTILNQAEFSITDDSELMYKLWILVPQGSPEFVIGVNIGCKYRLGVTDVKHARNHPMIFLKRCEL